MEPGSLISINEEQRLCALGRLNILDSAPEPQLDEITALAAHLCEAPVALISLVDRDRQWFKSRYGIETCETPRTISFCAHAIHHPEMLVIPDTRADDRFKDNPLVTGEPYVKFYAGMPLSAPGGYRLGTLCIIDYVLRPFTAQQRERLEMLARQVTSLLHLRSLSLDQAELISELNATQAQLAKALRREQKITEHLQQSFLPDLSGWSHPEVEVAALYRAALDEALVGGDFYDVYPLNDDHVALIVGDVVGKGLAAAALTAEIRFSLRILMRQADDPAAALARLNDLMAGAEDTESLRYASVIAVKLNTVTGKAQLAMAASEDAMVLRRGGPTERFIRPGMPLGVIAGREFALCEFTLKAGDTLILLTDGIIEARRHDDFLGYEAAQALAESARSATLHELASVILTGAQAFAAGRMHDDACLLLARMK